MNDQPLARENHGIVHDLNQEIIALHNAFEMVRNRNNATINELRLRLAGEEKQRIERIKERDIAWKNVASLQHALAKILAHTAHNDSANKELLTGLLSSIARIAKEAYYESH